jgi:hypothetical protein
VFENRVLRRIFGPKMDEVTGEWRKVHIEEFNNLHCSPNIVRTINSRRMRLARHVASTGRGEACVGFWWGNPRKRDHLENPDLDKMIILKCIFSTWDGAWTGLI